MQKKILKQRFFDRPVLTVAPELLGKFLVKEGDAFMITEVEAYDGERDRACHACRGKTARTEPMYGPPGHFYVYLVYGMYFMLNVVTGPREYPAAVLIRAVEGKHGPGILTRDLKIGKEYNGEKAAQKTGMWFEDRGVSIAKKDIRTKPRVGVSYAGSWAKKPWNFSTKIRPPESA